MAWRKSPPALVAAFDAALPKNSGVRRRQMFGYPAAFVNGHLFAGLHQDDVIARLPDRGRAKAVREGGRLWSPMPGRVMREYVALTQVITADPRRLSRWLKAAFKFADKLPPRQPKKPTRVKTRARPISRSRKKKP